MSGSFAAEFNPAVSHTALKVSDLEAALRFYRDTIGLPFVRSQGPEERPAVVWLRGLQLVRRTPEEIGERGALDHIGLGVDNIEAVCARVEQDVGSSVSPSPRKHHTLRSLFGIRPRDSRYLNARAW